MDSEKSSFDKLYSKSVAKKVEEKNGAKYLPWASAWAELLKEYPNSYIEEYQNPNGGLPIFGDPNKGYMVMCTVVVNDVSHTEMLPVTDYNNYAMLDEKRIVKKRYWDKTTRSYKVKDIEVEAIDSFHVNTARKRCLAKAIALHGLGLHLYQKEEEIEEATREKKQLTDEEFSKFIEMEESIIKRYMNSYDLSPTQMATIEKKLTKSSKTANKIKESIK